MNDKPIEQRASCLAAFGFGSGYHLVDGSDTFMDVVLDGKGYCNERCPMRSACWEQFRAGVENEHPIECDDWQIIVYNAARKWRTSRDIAHERAKRGRMAFGAPDPYTRIVLSNMDKGMERRKADEPGIQNVRMFRPGVIARGH